METKQSDSRSSKAKQVPEKKVIVELKVYMHCPACEKLVYKTLRKFEGVAAVKVDKESNQAVVAGKFKVQKLLKKLKKKTGKKAEIVQLEEEEDPQRQENNCDANNDNNNKFHGANYYENFHHENYAVDQDCSMWINGFGEDYVMRPDDAIFSDENTNACTIL